MSISIRNLTNKANKFHLYFSSETGYHSLQGIFNNQGLGMNWGHRKILIASDIFGQTAALEALISRIAPLKTDVKIVDPYNGIDHQFKQEKDAYSAFQEKTGFEKYSFQVRQEIEKYNEAFLLIGFSVGASAVWANLNFQGFTPGATAVCFYGSQIRTLAHIDPVIPTHVYFPVKEDHFNVQDLKRKLASKPNANCIQTPFLHGFMNQLSNNYDETGYLRYIKKIRQL